MVASGHSHDRQRQVGDLPTGHPARQVVTHAELDQVGHRRLIPFQTSGGEQLGQIPDDLARSRFEFGDQRLDVYTVAVFLEQPSAGTLHEAADVHPQQGLDGGVHVGCAGDGGLEPAGIHQVACGQLSTHHIGRCRTGLGTQSVGCADALGIDEAIHRHGGDDLAGQWMVPHLFAETLAQRRREILDKPVCQIGIVRQLGCQHVFGEAVLHRRQQHRQLWSHQSPSMSRPGRQCLAARQALRPTGQLPTALQRRHQLLMHAGMRVGRGQRVGQCAVLGDVIFQHRLGDLVGHLVQQTAAFAAVQPTGCHLGVQQDLDVDFVV